ncbi:hypothetical protein HOLleu_38797 [Holothuria leucospilota]|uniref:Uncharacterized protein n=1 Tax=Holothuria leucospilota TaxID=206669 RepID=A0A9Q0YF23_HOLLE|nr:hypothetical protein HOLleu_38797 [Holothuria leucospilota]
MDLFLKLTLVPQEPTCHRLRDIGAELSQLPSCLSGRIDSTNCVSSYDNLVMRDSGIKLLRQIQKDSSMTFTQTSYTYR